MRPSPVARKPGTRSIFERWGGSAGGIGQRRRIGLLMDGFSKTRVLIKPTWAASSQRADKRGHLLHQGGSKRRKDIEENLRTLLPRQRIDLGRTDLETSQERNWQLGEKWRLENFERVEGRRRENQEENL